MNINDYYFHTISKFNVDNVLEDFNEILCDGRLKSQKLLGNSDSKFNGLDYISLASYVEPSEYKVFVIDEENFKNSKLSRVFSSYNKYLDFLKLDNYLEQPISMKEYFEINNTTNKRDYFNYVDSISRTYPVDINYLYKLTNDIIYKYILDMINDEILYCNKSEYCFDEYIRKSNGITFIFPKNISTEKVTIIPNLPFEIESKLVDMIQNSEVRYSNQIGEFQIKDYIDIDNASGIIVNKDIDLKIVKGILKKYNYNIKTYKLIENKLIEI